MADLSCVAIKDMVMMATLLSRVQLLRDLKALKLEAKAEEQRRLEQLMLQSSIKVSLRLIYSSWSLLN